MKKVKYAIYFENCENDMSSRIELSKKQFNEQLKFLRNQVKLTAEDETPVIEREARVHDLIGTTETIYCFGCGCAFTDLVKLECKEGYCFARKNKKKVNK